MYMYLWILGEGVASSSPTPEPISDLILDLIFSADMEDHSKKIYETRNFHLTNITGSKIKTYLDHESIEAIIDAFVTTNLRWITVIRFYLDYLKFS